MKKILAVLLAMVLAFGCTAVAFAEGEATSTDPTSTTNKAATWTCVYCEKLFHNISYEDQIKHMARCSENPENKYANPLICPYCGNRFYQEDQFNAHIATCYGQAHINYDGPYTDADGNTISPPNGTNFFNLSASQILDKLVEVFDINSNWWDGIEDVIIRLVDFIENIGLFASAEGDVAGAVDDLDAKVESLGIVGDVYNYIKNLINTLKQKIKDFYAGNRETEPVEETTGAEPVATGSSTIGIAAFAAVSVAAAAAYVCVKKKEN